MLQHVTRVVAPELLEQCVSFYRLFGLTPVDPPPGIAGRAVWLAPAETPVTAAAQLHLMTNPQARPELGHIALIAARFDETVERLQSAGYEVERRTPHWDSPRAYVDDPAGNRIEMMERAPA